MEHMVTEMTPVTIKQYVRDQHGHPRGLVLAAGPNEIGWSLCHKSDKFDKELGEYIAFNRALSGSRKPVPHSIQDDYERMKDRAKRYFKS